MTRDELKALLENNHINSKHFDLDHLVIEAVTFKEKIQRVQMQNLEEDLEPIFSHNQTGTGVIR